MRILLTGAGGFLGQNILESGLEGHTIQPLSLRNTQVSQISFSGIDSVIHLAGIAHQKELDSEAYFQVNHKLSVDLATRAKESGVTHFVYFSSSKVYGEFTQRGEAFNETSPCNPKDAYGMSKLLAEQDILALANPNFIVTIVRTPVILGAYIKGNFKSLMALVRKVPILPLGNTNNQRSIVSIENLVNYLEISLRKKVGGVLIYKDPQDVSTTEILQIMAVTLNTSLWLVRIPNPVKWCIKKILPGFYSRLFSSFKLDNSLTLKKLDWNPLHTTEEGVQFMVESNL